MKITRRHTGPTPQINARSSIQSKSVMITYGKVNSNNTDGTCNVDLVTGFLIEGVKIPSSYYPSKEPVTGGICYPPVGTEVRILYPDGDINSGWIENAHLNTRDSDVTSELLGQGDIEIIPGGWSKTFDQETGKAIFINGTFNLEIDPAAESVNLTDFKGNTIVMDTTKVVINGNFEVLQ